MAAEAGDIGQVKAGLQDITECCICAQRYKVPKILPCIHTFCLRCLESLGSNTAKGPGDSMPCPICRKEFAIPVAGFAELPKNFFMDRLIDMINVLSPTSAQCEACAEDLEIGSEAPAAVTYCVDCRQNICSECSKHHRRMKATRMHKLVQLGSDEAEAVSLERAVGPSICDQHSNQSLEVYCADCKTISCAICFIETHNNHRGSQIDKVVDDFRKEIQTIIDNVGVFSENVRTKLEQMNDQNKKTLEQIGLLAEEVDRTKDEVKKLIDDHAAELNRKLDMMKHEKIKEFQTEKGAFETHIDILENYRKYCNEMLAKGSAGDVCHAANDLNLRGVELQEMYESIMEREISPFHVSFERTSLKDFIEEQNIVGVLEEKQNNQRPLNTERTVYKDKATVVSSFNTREGKTDSKKIWGLAVLDNELFTATDECAEIEVYDLEHFSIKRRFVLSHDTQQHIDIQDIAACKLQKCLYIMNWGSINRRKEILRVNVNGNLKKRWSMGSEFGRLSVSNEGSVIVTIIWKDKLKEYSMDGGLLREIKLSTVVHPRHAVRLNQDLFAVGFGDDEDSLHGVSIVDHLGNSIVSYGGTKGPSYSQVNCPLALVVDNEGSIIVADEKNCRLLLLGSNLEFKKVIATEKCGLQDPWRLHLDSLTGRIFVADNATKDNDKCRVLVLDLK